MSDQPPPPGPSFGRPSKTPRQRARIDLDGIVEAARGLLLRDGLEAVTMRGVAQELGTGAASLYAHVADKDELVQLLFDRVVGDVPLPAIDPARWREQLGELGRAIHRVLTAHRDIARASLGRIPTSPNVLAVADRMLGIMLAGGVPARVAALAVDTISLYVTAAAYEQSIWGLRVDADDPQGIERYVAGVHAFYAALSKERYPHLSAHTDELMGDAENDRFEFGLGLLIEGIAGRS